MNSSTCLNILYLNAHSILPKLIELRAICEAISYDVVCIVETWLDSEISDAELYISGYRVFRHDRNRHGGGVLVYVKNQFVQDASVVELSLFDDNLEFLPISFTFCNHRFCIATFYRPPGSSSSYFENLQFAVQQL